MAMTDGITPVMNVGENGGMFGGGSGSFLWVFFLFFLLAWGGNGFGGGAANSEMPNDFLYTNLNTQIMRAQDQNTMIYNDFQNQLTNLGYANLSNFKDMTAQMANCCCQTNRNIDALRFENQKNTCDIIQAGNANTDRILQYLTQNEIQELRDKLANANMTLNNAEQTANIINAVRPFPSPAYVTCSPYTSPVNGTGGGTVAP